MVATTSWTEERTNSLRFVCRDGKFILQQAYLKRKLEWDGHWPAIVWYDVPVVAEAGK